MHWRHSAPTAVIVCPELAKPFVVVRHVVVATEHKSMFGLFKSLPFHDPQLGKLVRSRGLWRGSITVSSASNVPLAVSGTRTEPDAVALHAARDVATQFPLWRPSIETAMFAHYLPYAEAIAMGDLPPASGAFPRIEITSQLWSLVSLRFVSVTPLDGLLTIELGYSTRWDEEHTLGARFQAGRFVELCGSVLPP